MMTLSLFALNAGTLKGFGPLGLEGIGADQAPCTFNLFLSTVIGVMTVIAMIWFTIQVFIGAIDILRSGGDKNKLGEARGKITSSLLGLVVVVSMVFLIDLIGDLLGLPFILNPGEFIIAVSGGGC